MANPPIPGTSTASMGAAPNVPRIGRLGHAPHATQLRDLKGQFAAGFGFNWIGVTEVARYFESANTIPTQGTQEVMRALGEKAIQWAKDNARWEDRSGDARGLGAANTDPAHLHYVVTQETNNQFTLNVAHGVPYGVYLEARPDLAILAEAILVATNSSTEVLEETFRRYMRGL